MTREEAIKLIDDRMCFGRGKWSKHHMPERDIYWIAGEMAIKALEQPESCEDADKLKRCKSEYVNACKIVAHQTPDTRKSDVYDAYAVMKALHPIFGDVEF